MLLRATKPETDRFLGKPLMARNIFGLPGEKAFKYRQGDFDVVVGFLNDIARYCASVRRSGPLKEFSSPELSLSSRWTLQPRSGRWKFPKRH
jgi:hypothetical protein